MGAALAGHASGEWLDVFRELASHRWPAPSPDPFAEAAEQEDRTWVIVRLPAVSRTLRPEPELEAVSALISQADGMEQQSQSEAAQTEAAVRDWWARQQR